MPNNLEEALRRLALSDDGASPFVGDRELCNAAANHIANLEARLALATGWMQAKGATLDELRRMGLPKSEE